MKFARLLAAGAMFAFLAACGDDESSFAPRDDNSSSSIEEEVRYSDKSSSSGSLNLSSSSGKSTQSAESKGSSSSRSTGNSEPGNSDPEFTVTVTCTETGSCDAMVKTDVSTWHFVRKDAFGDDAEYTYKADGRDLIVSIKNADGSTETKTYSMYNMESEVGVEMAFNAAKSTCEDGGGNDVVKESCTYDTTYVVKQNYDWIDGKMVFPAGTFDCETYDCFTTEPLNPDLTYGEILDERDGQVYKVIQIGKQVWFAQNLNFKTDSSKKKNEYLGRSYHWCDAMDLPSDECGEEFLSNVSDINHQGRCPSGWHIPNKSETIEFFRTLGSSSLNYKLSSRVSTDFTSDSTNMSGISIVYDNRWVDFLTSSEYNESHPWVWTWCLGWDTYADFFPDPENRVDDNLSSKTEYMTIRCIKDDPEVEITGEPLLPDCDSANEGGLAPKGTMEFVCKNAHWYRLEDMERETYGETCSEENVGKVINGRVDHKEYICTADGWKRN